MTITHKHVITISPNDVEAKKIINDIKAKVTNYHTCESTVAISIEWYENCLLDKGGENE